MSTKDAEQFVTLARNLSASGHHARAFEEYLLILKTFPRLKRRLTEEFRSCLYCTNERLSPRYRRKEIFSNIEKAVAALPRCVELLDDIGKYLRLYGCYSEALGYYERAYGIDRISAKIERRLNQVKTQLFGERYFRMLNNKFKNESYVKAITSVVRPMQEITVILNPGPGLLALYVNNAEPASCVVVEQTVTLEHIAKQVLADTQKKGNQSKSGHGSNYMRVVINETTLLVTDDFDAGLFGRGVLENLSNAWDILVNTRGVVLPARAEFYIMGAQCDSLHKRLKLTEEAKDMLDVPGWTVRSVLLHAESYVSEDVNTYHDMVFLTKAERLYRVELNSYDDVKYFMNRYKPTRKELTAIKSGTINCIVGFFKLYLTDDVILTTDPRSSEQCKAWQQAVFINEMPIDVIRNSRLSFAFVMHRGLIALMQGCGGQVEASPDIIRFLNDQEYMKAISDSVSAATIYLGQTAEVSELDILDLCPFPMFGFLMLKRGANSLTCRVNTYSDRAMLESAVDLHDIPMSKLKFVSDTCEWDAFKRDKFHAIYEHPFRTDGDLNFLLNRQATFWSRANLHEDGLVLPATISVMGILADSPILDIDNVLEDRNLCGYQLAKKLNRYSVNIRKGVNISNLEYTALSQPFVVAENLRDMAAGAVEVEVQTNGAAHSLLTYYKITVMGDLQTTSNKVGSFIDNMVYSSEQLAQVRLGDRVNFLRCVDRDGTFKICFDLQQ